MVQPLRKSENMKHNDNARLWELPCFEEELIRILSGREKEALPADGLVTAAVLIPLFHKDGRRHVLLTKRSEFVEHHRGEISFPGGKLDPEDPDLQSCALRETAEELGVAPEHVRILGELDDFYTVATQFHVVPFVGSIPYPYDFKLSAREIAGLVGPPLEIFFDPDRRSEEIWHLNGQAVNVVFYRWEGHTIWGATARILKHFAELLEQWQPGPETCGAYGISPE
jgi:8-oxo-dGTP pyrophosphatase MutT (NUDIX family)